MMEPTEEVLYYDMTDGERACALVRPIGGGRFHVAACDGDERVVTFDPVHGFGEVVEDDELLEEARERGIWIEVPRVIGDRRFNHESLHDALAVAEHCRLSRTAKS